MAMNQIPFDEASPRSSWPPSLFRTQLQILHFRVKYNWSRHLIHGFSTIQCYDIFYHYMHLTSHTYTVYARFLDHAYMPKWIELWPLADKQFMLTGNRTGVPNKVIKWPMSTHTQTVCQDFSRINPWFMGTHRSRCQRERRTIKLVPFNIGNTSYCWKSQEIWRQDSVHDSGDGALIPYL